MAKKTSLLTYAKMIRQGKNYKTEAAKRAEHKKGVIEAGVTSQVLKRKEERSKSESEKDKKRKMARAKKTLTGSRYGRDADATLKKIQGK